MAAKIPEMWKPFKITTLEDIASIYIGVLKSKRAERDADEYQSDCKGIVATV